MIHALRQQSKKKEAEGILSIDENAFNGLNSEPALRNVQQLSLSILHALGTCTPNQLSYELCIPSFKKKMCSI